MSVNIQHVCVSCVLEAESSLCHPVLLLSELPCLEMSFVHVPLGTKHQDLEMVKTINNVIV